MKRDEVYTFAIRYPLTPSRHAAVGAAIKEQAKATTETVAFAWDEQDAGQLHVDVGPVKLDVVFYDDLVEVYADAPLWARMAITSEKEKALVDLVRTVLVEAGLAEAIDVRGASVG